MKLGTSPEVLSLSLTREDVPAEVGLVAQEQVLATLAPEAFPAEASAA